MCEVFFLLLLLLLFYIRFAFPSIFPLLFLSPNTSFQCKFPWWAFETLGEVKKERGFFFHFTKRRKDRGEVKEERAEIRTCLLFLMTDKWTLKTFKASKPNRTQGYCVLPAAHFKNIHTSLASWLTVAGVPVTTQTDCFSKNVQIL